jgi:DNA-binding transcriptional LysR family regulator
VWVTSETHCLHEQVPVPIAIYGNSGWCKDFAIRSLEQRDIHYRVAYVSDTNGGLRLAVTSGLAIAPISRSNIPQGCRELKPEDGFGDIDSSHVVLHRSPKARSAAVDGMAEAIREAFTGFPT